MSTRQRIQYVVGVDIDEYRVALAATNWRMRNVQDSLISNTWTCRVDGCVLHESLVDRDQRPHSDVLLGLVALVMTIIWTFSTVVR